MVLLICKKIYDIPEEKIAINKCRDELCIFLFLKTFRYCLSCQKTLMYPVYNVYEVKKNHNLRKDDDVPPKAFLVVQNLMWEVFRQDSSVENQKVNSTKSKSRSFANMKRQWECQFLKICLWTPVSNTKKFKN